MTYIDMFDGFALFFIRQFSNTLLSEWILMIPSKSTENPKQKADRNFS